MPAASASIASLYAEAARCERIALGLSDPALIAQLTAWASEYRRDARQLVWAQGGARLAA